MAKFILALASSAALFSSVSAQGVTVAPLDTTATQAIFDQNCYVQKHHQGEGTNQALIDLNSNFAPGQTTCWNTTYVPMPNYDNNRANLDKLNQCKVRVIGPKGTSCTVIPVGWSNQLLSTASTAAAARSAGRKRGPLRGRNAAKGNARVAAMNTATSGGSTTMVDFCPRSYLEINGATAESTEIDYDPIKAEEQQRTCSSDPLTGTLNRDGDIRIGHTANEDIIGAAAYSACCTVGTGA